MSSLRKFNKKITVALLAVMMVFGLFANSLISTAAAGSQIDPDQIVISLSMKDGQNNDLSGNTINGVNHQEYVFTLNIAPILDELLKLDPDTTEDVKIEIQFPEGTKIKEEFFDVVAAIGQHSDGSPAVSRIVPEIVKQADGVSDSLVLTINDIFAWQTLSEISVNYTFKASNLFPNFTTAAGKTDSIKIVIDGHESLAINLVAADRVLIWKGSAENATASHTPATKIDVDDTVTSTLMTITPNKSIGTNLTYDTPAGLGDIKANKITVQQVITYPDDVNILDATTVTAIMDGIEPTSITVNNATKTITVVWNDVQIPEHTNTTLTMHPRVTIGEYEIDADVYFVNDSGDRVTGGSKAIEFNSTTNVTIVGIDGTTANVNDVTSKLTSTVNGPFTAPAPENFGSSGLIAGNATSDDVYNNAQFVIGAMNGNNEAWSTVDYIKNSTGLTYDVTKFSYGLNDSGNVINKSNASNFTITQSFADTPSNKTSSTAERIMLDKIFVAPVADADNTVLTNKSVEVILTLVGGDTVSCGNVVPGTTGTTVDVATCLIAAGKSALTNDNAGNVVSVSYNYGNVAPGFHLADAAVPNSVTANAIPHFIAGTPASAWSDLDAFMAEKGMNPSALTPENITEINKYVKGSGSINSVAQYFKSSNTVSFTATDTNVYSKKVESTNSSTIKYFDTVPKIEADKYSYNVSREVFDGFNYASGDEVEFLLFIRYPKVTELGDSYVGYVNIEDIMKSNNVDISTVSEVTWEIYSESITPKQIIDGTKTPVISGTDEDGGKYTPVTTEAPYTYQFQSVNSGNKATDWDDDGSTATHTWEWFGKLNPGNVLVLRYTVVLGNTGGGTFDTEVKNDFNTYAEYFFDSGNGDGENGGGTGTGNNNYESIMVNDKGGIVQEIDPVAEFLDVEITSESEEDGVVITPGDNDTFTVTARVEKFIQYDGNNTDLEVSVYLPYGWTWNNDAVITGTKYGFKNSGVTNEVINNYQNQGSSKYGISVTPGTTAEQKYTLTYPQGTSTTISSTKVTFYFKDLKLDDKQYYEFEITFSAKSPSAEVVYYEGTKGYTQSTTYSDRVFATASMGANVFRNFARNIYAVKGNNFITSKNNFLTDEESTILNPNSVNHNSTNFYNGRKVFGKADDNSNGIDTTSIYGFADWDNDPDIVNGVLYYANVSYTTYDYKPVITITPSITDILLGNTAVNYYYDIKIENTSTDPIPLFADTIHVRLPEYVDYAGTAQLLDDGLTAVANSGLNIVKTNDETSTLSTGYELVASFNKVQLAPGSSYTLRVNVTVNPATFGPSGGGNDYLVSTLRNGITASAAMVAITGSPQPATGTNLNVNNAITLLDNTTANPLSLKPFSRENGINISERNGWFVSNKSVVKVDRAAINPGIEKTASIKQFGGGWVPITDTTTINNGSTVRWEIKLTNPNNGSAQQVDITDAIVYDVMPDGLKFVSSAYNNVEITSALGKDVTGTVCNAESDNTLMVCEGVNIAIGDTVTITFETIILDSDNDLFDNEAYIVPTGTIQFNAIDVSKGTYVSGTDISEIIPSETRAGAKATKTIFPANGIGVSAKKRVLAVDSMTGEGSTQLYLGSEAVYTLEIRNTHSTNEFNNLVVIDKLPEVGDKYYNKPNQRNSEFSMLFDQPITSLEDVVTVAITDASGNEKVLNPGDYELLFGNVAEVQESDFAANYTGSDFTLSLDDDITGVNMADYNAIRFQLFVPLEVGDRIVIKINTHVPTFEECMDLGITEPLDLDGKKAVNNFAFQVDSGAMRSSIYNTNTVTLYSKVSKVSIHTFLDENMNGFDDEGMSLEHDALVDLTFVEKESGDVAHVDAIYGDEYLELYGLNPEKDYDIYFSETVVDQRRYYWFSPTDFITETIIGANPTMIDQDGVAVLDDFSFGENKDVYAGYYVTGPRIFGYIWHDINKNGLIDESEEYLEDVKVTLYRCDGAGGIRPVDAEHGYATTYTDEDGFYYLDLYELEEGYGEHSDCEMFILKVEMPNGYNTFTTAHVAGTHGGIFGNDMPMVARSSWTAHEEYLGSLADEDGYIQFFNFPTGYLNAGVHYVEPPKPVAPETGVNIGTSIWVALATMSLLCASYYVMKSYKREEE